MTNYLTQTNFIQMSITESYILMCIVGCQRTGLIMNINQTLFTFNHYIVQNYTWDSISIFPLITNQMSFILMLLLISYTEYNGMDCSIEYQWVS